MRASIEEMIQAKSEELEQLGEDEDKELERTEMEGCCEHIDMVLSTL